MIPKSDRKVNRPPVLFAETQKLIDEIERRIEGRFLTYWTSPDGMVCDNDVLALYEVLQTFGHCETMVCFINSSGGDGQSSLRMVNLLRKHADRVIATIASECASAATMMALGADEIRMGPLAYLTAVDTSLTHALSPVDKENNLVSVSLDELVRVVNLWRHEAADQQTNPYEPLFQHIHPLVIGAIDRSSSLSIKLCTDILSYHMDDHEKAEKISRHLNSHYPSHDYPITLREAQELGLNVTELDGELNELLLDLNEVYSEMGQKAITDHDEHNYHSNNIVNILEGRGIQVFYQHDKDWHYMREERRWVSINDKSSWHRVELVDGRVRRMPLHIL